MEFFGKKDQLQSLEYLIAIRLSLCFIRVPYLLHFPMILTSTASFFFHSYILVRDIWHLSQIVLIWWQQCVYITSQSIFVMVQDQDSSSSFWSCIKWAGPWTEVSLTLTSSSKYILKARILTTLCSWSSFYPVNSPEAFVDFVSSLT